MDFTIYLLSLFSPQVLVGYFKLISHNKEGEALHLYLEEAIDIPKEFSDLKFIPAVFIKKSLFKMSFTWATGLFTYKV
ncbi:MAG: hypothetical protein COA88_15110 [Kordia sp.]|nr:MAG: hypothetical protein COA88_15110 [Kordia sp.]